MKAVLGILAAAVLLTASAETFRGFAVKNGERLEFWTATGQRHVLNPAGIPESALNREAVAQGRFRKGKNDAEPILTLTRMQPWQPKPFSPTTARGRFAKTNRTLPEAELKPDNGISQELPELGNSASSSGAEPIKMFVHLPRNYRRDTPHPVLIHFGGGTGGTGDWSHWNSIIGGDDFIIVTADYNYDENKKRGTLDIGTCRDFDSKIAYHVLQILNNSTAIDPDTVLLTGYSSGAYSITDNFKKGNPAWQKFSGFCAIAGGSNTGSARIGDRPTLFVMGENDTIRHKWLADAERQLRAGKPAKLTVEYVKGTGHEWSDAQTPAIRKWLAEFPAYGAAERLEKMAQDAPNDEAKKIIASWQKE